MTVTVAEMGVGVGEGKRTDWAVPRQRARSAPSKPGEMRCGVLSTRTVMVTR